MPGHLNRTLLSERYYRGLEGWISIEKRLGIY